MFSNLKGLFSPNNKDLRKRILFTLAVLAIFIIGSNIMVPGAKAITSDLGFLELLSLMTGGNLETFSIFALGVGPYISASIITQLLQMDIIPYFKELKEQGATGRQKINRITRYLGILFAFVQGYIFSYAYLKGMGSMTVLKTTLYISAGSSLLVWLSDEVTNKGLGNGMSLIIMAGIVKSLPGMFITAFNDLILAGNFSTMAGVSLFVLFVIVYIAIIIGVIFIETSQRRIPIQYSNRTSGAYNSEQSYIPIKLNSAGVMPVIFASAIFGIPQMIAGIVSNENVTNIVTKYLNYSTPVGFIIYIVLIFAFGYVYTLMELNPDEMSENLDKNRSYIPGVKPGEKTAIYLKEVITRLTVVGSLFLIVLAALPILIGKIPYLSNNVTLGGTGLLIVVGVALETYKQLESSIVSRSYKGSRKRRRR